MASKEATLASLEVRDGFLSPLDTMREFFEALSDLRHAHTDTSQGGNTRYYD